MQLALIAPLGVVLGALALHTASAASVGKRGVVSVDGSNASEHKQLLPRAQHRHPRKKKHPKHPKHKHPHPHPHPHPKHTAAPQPTTATTTVISSTTTVVTPTPSPRPPPPQIRCTLRKAERALYNVGFYTYENSLGSDPPLYPYPRLTFSEQAHTRLISIASDKPYVNVDQMICTSTYMDYDQFTYNYPPRRRNIDGDEQREHTASQLVRRARYQQQYGIIKITGLDLCIVATAPGTDHNTKFTLADCSYDDDASQVPQYFRFTDTSDGPAAQYLGARYADTTQGQNSDRGLRYTIDTGSINSNQELNNFIDSTPTTDDISFYFDTQVT